MKDDGRKEHNTAEAKKTVAETVNYAEDIAPYRCIGLWSGVGSGKNYFAERFFAGSKKHNIPRLTVLIISSRKSKVLETLTEFEDYEDGVTCRMSNAANKYYYRNMYGYVPDEFVKTVYEPDGCKYEIVQRSVVCTNAYIEGYHRYVYDPLNPETHLWNRFDIIIWDEVHSLIMDSSYQSAPFYVARLFSETFRRMENRSTENDEYFPADYISPRCDKLILMSGTQEAIEGITILPELHELDYRQVCINVGPRNIFFLDSGLAVLKIRAQLDEGKRIVYFTNHIVLSDELSRKYGISTEKLAVSFSDDDRRGTLNENDRAHMEMVEKYLAENQRIHPAIQLFYTTSRNKEGINIEDTDINDVYIEAHDMTDIKQMAGRMRHGVENLYIILDAKGYGDSENRWECAYAKQVALETNNSEDTQLNANLRQHCLRLGINDFVFNMKYSLKPDNYKNRQIISYIDLMKSKSPYFEYDYISNSFWYNRYREKSRLYYEHENGTFEEAYYREDLVYMFSKAFPEAVVHEPEFSKDRVDEIVENMKTRFAAGNLAKADVEAYAAELDMLLVNEKTRSKRTSGSIQINRILKRVGLSYERKSHNKKSPNYNVWELTVLATEDDMVV